MSLHRTRHSLRRAALVFCVMLAAILACQDPARAQALPLPPAPNAQDGEFSAFDLYVGNTLHGAVFGHFGPDWFAPAMPADVLALLPAVKNPETFLQMFEGRIEKTRAIRGLGVLRVDAANFRLDLEVDREQAPLSGVDLLANPPEPEGNLALRNTAFVAGSAPTQDFDMLDGMSLRHSTVLSRGPAALQSSGTFTQGNGYDLQTALLRGDFRAAGLDLTGFAGLLETGGDLRFARGLQYTGARLATNQTLLFRDQQLQGSAIEIFLPRRAQVKIFRDGEASGDVLYSRIMDFGTVQVDTRAFPQGSYDIEIVTYEGGAVVSRETRPFMKNQSLPPRGKPVFSLDFGQTRDVPGAGGDAVVQAAGRARLTDFLGGGLGVAATGGSQVYEATLSAQAGTHIFRTAGLIESYLTGAYADTGPAGLEAGLSWTSRKASARLAGNRTYARAGALALSDRQSLNLSFSMPFEIARNRLLYSFSSEVSKTSATGKTYHFGPSLSYVLDDIGTYTPEMKVELSRSDTDDRILATLTLRDTSPVWTQNARFDTSRVGGDKSVSALASLGYNGRSALQGDWRGRMNGALGLRMDPLHSSLRPSETVASADLEYAGTFARLRAFADQSLSDGTDGVAGGELESTIIWSREAGLRATGENAGADMALAMVTLRGEAQAEFDVTLNGIRRESVKTGETVILPLPVYEQVTLNVVDRQSHSTMKAQEGPQVLTGYPGNVVWRGFTVVKSWIIMGTLTDAAGAPLPLTRFTIGPNAYYTDESGFFTMEEVIRPGDALAIRGEGFSCAPQMPQTEPDALFADLALVACATENPGSPRREPGSYQEPG